MSILAKCHRCGDAIELGPLDPRLVAPVVLCGPCAAKPQIGESDRPRAVELALDELDADTVVGSVTLTR